MAVPLETGGRGRPVEWSPNLITIQAATEQKTKGNVYTPAQVARFILRWAFNGHQNYDVLEPSCGGGAFLKAVKDEGVSYHSISALEIDSTEAEKARGIALHDAAISVGDFHQYCLSTKDRFDLVVGNPPFIRYQYFDDRQQALAASIFTRAGLKYSKLANPWASFVVGSTLLLRDAGKLGMVVPAEILQVGYARQVREYLAEFFDRIAIVSFERLIFPSVQQEVVLLLCQRTGTKDHRIDHIEVQDASRLSALDVTRLRSPTKNVDFHTGKWTFYFLPQPEINFLEGWMRRGQTMSFRKFARAEVGMTTGFNHFFSVDRATVKKYGLSRYARPLVGRSVQVGSVEFTKADWEKNTENGARAYFLSFPSRDKLTKNLSAVAYLEEAEARGIHRGYKCSVRDEWQIVPSAWVSQALFLRRNHLFPRFVINEAGAYTTDTMHRVTVEPGVDVRALVASYYNSLSFASTEVCGRSHGGGVLELMPNEVESVLVPYRAENGPLLPMIDNMMRDGADIDDILDVTDPSILHDGLGLSAVEIQMARGIWRRLQSRRFNRKHTRHQPGSIRQSL